MKGSPSKPPAGGSRTLPPPPVAAAAGSPVYPTRKGSVFIPFAQRQAKSHVAAREILKKGSKVGFIQKLGKKSISFVHVCMVNFITPVFLLVCCGVLPNGVATEPLFLPIYGGLVAPPRAVYGKNRYASEGIHSRVRQVQYFVRCFCAKYLICPHITLLFLICMVQTLSVLGSQFEFYIR